MRTSPIAESVYFREQAGRWRRLPRDSTDPALRDSLLRLAEDDTARASARDTDDQGFRRRAQITTGLGNGAVVMAVSRQPSPAESD